MTPGVVDSPIYWIATEKKMKLIDFKPVLRLTDSFIKKFRDMKLVDREDCFLPFKRRKISENVTNEDTDIDRIIDRFMLDLSSDFGNISKEVKSYAPVKKYTSSFIKPSAKGNNHKRFNFFKSAQKMKNPSSKRKKPARLQQQLCPTSSLQQLFEIYRNCVHFIQPRGYPAIEDIDLIVRRFSVFGKVLNIQDHWIKPRGSLNPHPCVWAGASVTYRNQVECDRAIKTLSVEHSFMICVSIVDHLARINHAESDWMRKFKDSKDSGTCIVIEGIIARTSRIRIEDEFENFGTVLRIEWNCGKELNKKACEVTYKTTVSAFAAALAFDGKNVQKGNLRTKIKIKAKELYIHRKLCESF